MEIYGKLGKNVKTSKRKNRWHQAVAWKGDRGVRNLKGEAKNKKSKNGIQKRNNYSSISKEERKQEKMNLRIRIFLFDLEIFANIYISVLNLFLLFVVPY